ncbi:Ribosome biogenesis protein [Yarrowia sp. B02]|nr:Ribosome biogenesis protein [Yarrowia sp. B02]
MSTLYKTLSGESNKPEKTEKKEDGVINKQRVLIITSRGVTFRQRHLISDLQTMLPHGRKESKLDTKSKLYQLNEIAEMYNCNNILYFEARKHMDLYMWLAKAPNGPTAKFHVQNLHTMDELNFTGNCLRGSRPILSFDSSFDDTPHNAVVKEMLTQTFGVPKGARKSKPFFDHVFTFSLVDNKIWFRNYQIQETVNEQNPRETDISLVEIGPRFVMTLITMLEGSFGGPVIFENKQYVSPNTVRSQMKQQAAEQAANRAEAAFKRKVKVRDAVISADPLADSVVFK